MEGGLFLTILSILTFLLLGSFLQLVSKRIHIPFTFLLVLAGVGLAFISNIFVPNEMVMGTDDLAAHLSFLHFIGNFSLSPDVVFYIFLPTLVFESAFNLRLSHLRQSIFAIANLSVLGLIFSMGIIAFSLHYIFGIPLEVTLLFGVIISATDPVAILAIFKEVGAPRRLRTIVEGESLFNDGTALVLFGILTTGLFLGEHRSFAFGFEDFTMKVLGGLAFGAFMGFLFSRLIGAVRENQNVEMSLALILAHSTFLFAEHLHLSGIIATVMAGVYLGNFGRHKISPNIIEIMDHFWDHMAFVVNVLVFFLIGISITQSSSGDFFLPSLIAFVVVTIARFATVIPLLSLGNLFSSKKQKIPFSWQIVISHGGLKGALAVVMLLLLPHDFEYLAFFQAVTVSIIILFFLVNATTIKWLMKKLGLMRFSSVDTLEIEESHVLVSHFMGEHLQEMYKKRYVNQEVYELISKNYNKAEKKAIAKIHRLFGGDFTEKELLTILQKHCLGVEQKIFHQLFVSGEIPESTSVLLQQSVERQRERLHHGERQEEKKSKQSFVQQFREDQKKVEYFLSFLSRCPCAAKILESWRRRKVIQKHDRYRVRRISAWNVLKHLQELENNHLFQEGEILNVVRENYEKWHENAKEKQWDLEKHFPQYLNHHQFYLTKRNCFNIERSLIYDLYEKGIIPQKVLMELQRSLGSRLHRLQKKGKLDEGMEHL